MVVRALSQRGLSLRHVGASDSRSFAATSECADRRPPLPDPALRGAHAGGRRRSQLAGGDRLRRRRHHRPDRRLPGASLAGRVAVRQGGRPARRPADDRRGRDPPLRGRPHAVGGPRRGGRPRSRPDAGLQGHRAAGVRAPGQPARQDGDVAPLRGDRLPHRHPPQHALAVLDLLDRPRARCPRRRSVCLHSVERTQAMKAVVMAGGEGTRLRPLTSNQPKPMVPIVGKPCMEHILELLKEHGLTDVIVTVAFLPQAIRSYFGEGDTLGMSIGYSVEESPLGTAGSVRLAVKQLDETFLVISGDALCDVDLSALVAFHKEREAAVTIGLKSVDNPLEFGIVVTDEEGRIERFLEKPSWGQVFSDTINTGIYVLEPEVLRHIPTDRPYDFSKELFPYLLEMGRPLYGYVMDGYWQDIGNLDQYRQANFDALDERARLDIPGIRLRGNVRLGEGVEVDDLAAIEGPPFIGNYFRIAESAGVGGH